MYGVIGFATTFFLDSLIASGAIKIEGIGIQSLMVRAIVVGLAVKALLHVRLFVVGAGGRQFPVGTETMMQLVEPWLLTTIALDESERVRAFVSSRAVHYGDVDDVRTRVKDNIPAKCLSTEERRGFVLDLDEVTKSVEIMEMYLRNFGYKWFNRVFPEVTTMPPRRELADS